MWDTGWNFWAAVKDAGEKSSRKEAELKYIVSGLSVEFFSQYCYHQINPEIASKNLPLSSGKPVERG